MSGLDIIWCLSEYRGKGLATQLLQWGFARADELKLPIFVDLATQFSQHLYETLGFETLEVVRSDEGPPRPELPVRTYHAMWRRAVESAG